MLYRFKTKYFRQIFFRQLLSLRCSTCIFFTENVTMPSSAVGSTTHQILFSSAKYFLSYSANRQIDRQTDGQTEIKDRNFRNLHSPKYEILKKSRRVIFFRLQYFPYVSKGSKIFINIDVLEKFFTSLNLKLNKNKTQAIEHTYNTSNIVKTFDNDINTLTTLPAMIFLGIKIDVRLDWKAHTDDLTNNVAKYFYTLKVILQNGSTEAAFMEPTLRYGIFFCGGTSHIYI